MRAKAFSTPSEIELDCFDKYKLAAELSAIISWTAELFPEKASLTSSRLSLGEFALISIKGLFFKEKSSGDIS